jgi:hypothetical protein
MSYKVYYADSGMPEGKAPSLLTLIPVEFVSKETAMAWAVDAKKRGATIWRIRGPGGSFMTQAEFETKYGSYKR